MYIRAMAGNYSTGVDGVVDGVDYNCGDIGEEDGDDEELRAIAQWYVWARGRWPHVSSDQLIRMHEIMKKP